MWNKSSWCERVILISSAVLLFILLFNIFTQQISFNIWLILYTVLLIFASIWITCLDVQFLLGNSLPNQKQEGLSKYQKINFAINYIPNIKKLFMLEENVEPVKKNVVKELHISSYSDISTIASVIERKCIWSWYSLYVSKEIAFPFACKELLDQMVTKIFQISMNVDMVHLCSDSLAVILRHCKEYKRAVKRLEKAGKGSIEDYYRNSHPTSSQRNSNTILTKGKSTQSHCLLLTRAFLKELLPWELWGTPHALLLASILSKRLDSFVSTSLANPLWLRIKIIKLLSHSKMSDRKTKPQEAEQPKIEKKLSKESLDFKPEEIFAKVNVLKRNASNKEIKQENSDVVLPSYKKTSIESALTNMISNSTAPILQRAEREEPVIVQNILIMHEAVSKTGGISISKKTTQPIEISTQSVNGFAHSPSKAIPKPKGSEVKIYDRIVEGSVRTWNTDVDLECVSLGQDLLASLDGDLGFESRLGRLWEADEPGSEAWSPNAPSTGSSTKTPHGLWFGEEDTLDMELTEDSPPKSTVQTNASNSLSNFNISKPLSIHNMKELQNISKNTVNQAKHKIGDLQDEAAGVMEGILDLGIAGLRKGLRLTGLQEEKSPMIILQKPPEKHTESQSGNLAVSIGQALTNSRKNSQSDELPPKSDFQKTGKEFAKSPNGSSQPNLVKQHRVVSQDGIPIPIKKVQSDNQFDQLLVTIDPLSLMSDSPDYEYEEAEDFASTIAKLRCLLQQKTGDVTPIPPEDITSTSHPGQDRALAPIPGPMSTSLFNTSPVHKPNLSNQNGSTKSPKSDNVSSDPSFDSENGFTILPITDFVEAEEALSIKVGQGGFLGSNPNIQGNNMQRLDKLFTRTVTGVFNTIKTAVGGDSLSDAVAGHTEASGGHAALPGPGPLRQQPAKDDWIFIEGDLDVSILVGRLLVERRGFCVVEAAQDSLEVLGGPGTVLGSGLGSSHLPGAGTPTHSPHDDLDESEVLSSCPLWQMWMELAAVSLGGVMQKDAILKCTSAALADMAETVLTERLEVFSGWLRDKITESFRELASESDGKSSPAPRSEVEEPLVEVHIQELCDAVLENIPALIFTLFGRQEIAAALQMLVSSIGNPLVNRDVLYNLLDMATLHFLKACESRNTYPTTPPPSA